MTDIAIDFARAGERLRALHGVNNGPASMMGIPSLTDYHRKLRLPSTRLHDVVFTNPGTVDLPCIFPRLDADPTDPANYRFGPTDEYLQAIVDVESPIVYRLGVSIDHSRGKHHTAVPADPEQWARICVGIVGHYNDGWADGFRHGIDHWEIWNEPDIGDTMWRGTPEQYYELYAATARAIKQHDPELKVGGPAWAGAKEAYFGPFLDFCRDSNVPLDFFSWHIYADTPAPLVKKAREIREGLDAHGFTEAETHLNEWHFFDGDWQRIRTDPFYARSIYERINGIAGAAFAAAALIELQSAPVDTANYYTGDAHRWGMFDRYGCPQKTYFAFAAFAELLDTPCGVATDVGNSSKAVAWAGVSESNDLATVLLSVPEGESTDFQLVLGNLPWPGETLVEVLCVDERRDLESTSSQALEIQNGTGTLCLTVAAPSVQLVRLQPR